MDLPREIRTERLLLRPWLDDDRDEFARINADPRVMEFFPGVMSRQESDASADRIEAHFRRHGFAQWAVEIPGVQRFIGFIGLSIPRFEVHFTPCVEVGWRLDADHWNRGLATEGARAALEFGFGPLGLNEIVSFTVPANRRSRRVMEKLGMTHAPADDFDHPLLPEGHPLRRHVLYRLTRQLHGHDNPVSRRYTGDCHERTQILPEGVAYDFSPPITRDSLLARPCGIPALAADRGGE